MKSVNLLLLFILYFTSVAQSQDRESDEKEKFLDAAEIHFARVFEEECQKLKEDSPLRLNEEILPIAILNEPETLHQYEAFNVFQWKSENFIVAATKNETSLFLITFSDRDAVLNEFIKIEHLNFVQHVDYLKILINDDDLWIFETSDQGNVVLVIRIKLNGGRRGSTLQQVIPVSNPITRIHPFISKNGIHLIVTALEHNRTATMIIFSEENEIFLKKFEESFSWGSSLNLNSFAYNGITYIILIGEEKSVVKRYESENKIQEIWSLPKRVQSFLWFMDEISRNLFLAFIMEDRIELFLFRDERFLAWNKILTNSDIKIGHFFSREFRNFLLLSNKENVSMYTQNVFGEFFPKWSFGTPCGSVKGVGVLSDDKRIAFITRCAGVRESVYLHQLQIVDDYELQMDSPQEDFRIEKCLNELESIMKRNDLLIPGLLKALDPGMLLSKDQTRISVENGPENLATLSSEKLDSLRSDVDNLSKIVDSIKNKTKSFEDQLPNFLTYEGSQHIDTTVYAQKMIANYSVIMSIDLEKLNELSLDDYRNKFMVLDKDQFVNTNFNFDKIVTKNINAKSLSTGDSVLLPDNLLNVKASNQIVSGQHKFSSLEVKGNIASSSSKSSSEINSINVNDIITKSTDVRFEGRHVFHRTLNADKYLSVKYLNGVDFDVWSRSVMRSTKDASLPFGGTILVEGNIRVAGNVKTVSVNGIDFNNLFSNIAKKSSTFQEFTDKIVFSNGLKVVNLETDQVNGLEWNHYLRMKDVVVEANFNIDDGVIIKDLKSASINGLNLGKDVLLSGPDQIVKGRITFVSDVEVTANNGVTMETGATINAIDPSLHSHIGHLSNDEVFHNKLNLGDVLEINGNIRVTRLNNVTFPEFQVGYWRKSKHQRIPNTVSIRKAVFKKSLHASTLNGFNVSDYVRTDVAQTLMARNFFVSDVLVHGNVYMENNRTINNVDLSILKDSSLSLHERQIVNGLSEFATLTADDFLSKDGTWKGINIEGLFATPQRYSNALVFTSPVVTHSLHARNLQVGKLNGKDPLESIYGQGAPISEIKGNLYVEKIGVNDLTFTKNLNEQNFNNWISSVVGKDEPSHLFTEKMIVKGEVSFTGSLDIDILNSKHLKTFIKKLNRDCDECEVRGRKVFLKPLEIFGDLFAEFINGVSLHELKERLLFKTKEQTIKGVYQFKGGLTSVTIEAPKIGGIPVNEIVLVDNIKLHLPTKFKRDVILDELQSQEGWMDGCKVEEIFNPPLTNVRNLLSNISVGHLEVTGNMTMGGRIVFRSNNEHLLTYIRKIVSKTSSQNIYGAARFQNQASAQSLQAKYVNDLRSQNVIEKFFTKQRDMQTNCSVEVEHLSVKEVIAADVSSEVLNNIKLRIISDFGVKRNSRDVITGQKIFPNAYIGNMEVQKINNVVLDSLMKLKGENSEQKLVFLKPISFAKNILVYGLIAQENAQSLLKHFDFKRLSNPLPFPPSYEQLIIEGDVNVKTVNNLNLADVFLKTSRFPVVTGRKNFIGGIIIEGGSKIDVINGFHPNLFREWPYVFSERMPERYVHHGIRKTSSDDDKIALSNEAFAIMRINEANIERTKGLYKKLFSITEADSISLSGDRIHTLRLSQSTVVHVFAEYDACLSRNLCPCFDTYTIDIKDAKLELDEVSFKGRNFPIILPETNRKLYNFNTRCSSNEIFTVVAQFHNTEEGIVVTTETKFYDLVLQVFYFSSKGRNYFVLYTKSKEGDTVTLNAVDANLKILWDEAFNASISKLVLKQVLEDWYLLVVMDEILADSGYLFDGTKLYIWNENKEQFVFVRSFPPAATGDITSFDNGIFIILGFDNPARKSFLEETLGSGLQIYKSVEKSRFYPYSSLPVRGVRSTAFFTLDNDLFFAVASKSENSVSVYRMIHHEGFSLAESFSVVNPSELNYVNIYNRQYLLVLHDKSVTLLNLNFKGASL